MTSITLAERKRERLDSRIEEFNLKRHVFDQPLLPDELIYPRLSNLARPVGGGIRAMIVSWRGPVHSYFEADRRPVLRRAQNHMEVAAVEPEYYLARGRFERDKFGMDVPRS